MSQKPTVVDLFSGVGGFSLGAARAGFKVLAAVENDPIAIASHARNFPNTIHLEKDIRNLTGSQLLKAIGFRAGELTGLIGGPPCQGFSNIGRRNGNDGRNHLFGHFFRLVDQVRPSFFLAENVPGIMTPKYEKMRQNALAKVPKCYTMLDPFPVRASDYGAPTTRTRIFFFGFDPSKFTSEFTIDDFDAPADAETITVSMALEGLPVKISDAWEREGAEWLKVVKKNGTAFMSKVTGHVPQGIGEKSAIEEYRENGRTSGCQGTKHMSEVVERFSKLKAGQTDSTSRAVRLDPKGFCPTLRAGTNRDKGSYQAIRPVHPTEPRVITPREAARLQGFPDWFIFHPTKWHSFRLIGNSVSPLVAETLLDAVISKLEI